ncbi:MAG: ribonucleoside reductase class II [Chloroflexi bacterium]|nr:ribonucleoside reductase class II [Chloroflexota bacterium]
MTQSLDTNVRVMSSAPARRPINLTPNARVVLEKRYLRRGMDGKPAETPEEMFDRVARTVAEPESLYGGDVAAMRERYYELLTDLRFFPNSPTFTGAGTPLGQLAACFVLPITDDMGRDSRGIFSTLRAAALIQQTGGGNGFSFSRLRPRGDRVATSAGVATGPVGFLRVYDTAFGEVAQGGTRRGANMAVLRVDHPDIFDFIKCKTDEGAVCNFNISVGITDAFMQAVESDSDFDLVNPRDGKVWRTVRARELFDEIVKHAHHNGEPGMLFLDAANRSNPVPHLYELEATNPCITGETLVYTENGLRRADELAKQNVPMRVATDGRFGMDSLMSSSPMFATGVRDVYRLMTREGYELRLTANHRVMTARGWVAACDLNPGDRVHILNRRGGFGNTGSLNEGRILGWLVGDGTVNAIRAVLSFFGEEKRELAPMYARAVSNLVERADQRRAYPVGVTHIAPRDEARVSSERLREWAARQGLMENKLQVPASVFGGCEEMQRGFLQALFTADGQVNDGGDKGCSVRLSSSHLPLLKDTQRLLLNFGIVSRIYEQRRAGGYRLMPDGKGGKKAYYHQPQHDLAISKTNLIRFANDIGFLTEAKQTKLANYLSRMTRGPYVESFMATVEAVESDGREMVYDLQQPETHSFVANGLVVHNCGEQWLGEYENCCLGSINLAQHITPDDQLDWVKLHASVETSTRFLDDVVDANKYVPAVPELSQAAHRARRIGLGIMGLGDAMYRLGVRYGSRAGEEFAAQVMEFVRYYTMQTSIELARTRGAFPAIKGSIYDPHHLQWTPPRSIEPYTRDFGRPALDWDAIVAGIHAHGIRNAAQTTVAPTGTIATVAGVESYGCEPVFALAYTRHVNDQGKDLELDYVSPLFERALIEARVDEVTRKKIFERVRLTGTCQDVDLAPAKIRDTFVVASDITPEEHVRMQAAMQAFVDNSLSKTINFSETATMDDVAKAYFLAWQLGCKGITVYVAGTRDQVVLETKETALKKGKVEPTPDYVVAQKKPREHTLIGQTYKIETPLGGAYVTVNRNGNGEPFEVFCNVGKAGSDTAAVSEAIGRLVSLALRLPSPLTPTERLEEVVKQLSGIGGGRPMGFGLQRVRSLPDGIAQALSEDLGKPRIAEDSPVDTKQLQLFKIGDLCPSCGHASFVNEEGCRKCYSCGHSEC